MTTRPRDVLLAVTLSVVISGGGWLSMKGWQAKRHAMLLYTLVQTGTEREVLPTSYLAELMGLSVDRPLKLHQLDVKALEARLLVSPLIREAHLERLPPHALLVDYTARRPLFRLVDVQKGAVSLDGALIPLSPFFTPKALPELYVGADFASWQWGKMMREEQVALVQEVHERVAQSGLKLAKIDVSRAFREKLGERELILAFEEERSLAYVRLLPHKIQDALDRYLLLHDRLGGEERVCLDLRLPETALVRKAK